MPCTIAVMRRQADCGLIWEGREAFVHEAWCVLCHVTLCRLRLIGAQLGGKVSKAGKGKGEKGDKLDDMISSYKAKYFGAQMQAAPAATQHIGKPAAGISRWFE